MHSTATITKIDTDEVYSLKERVRQLEDLLGARWRPPNALRLTPAERKMLGLLVKRSFCTREQIVDFLYGDRADPPLAADNIISVLTKRLRNKMAPFGLEISTQWGAGYFITPENLERLESLYGPGERPTTESP